MPGYSLTLMCQLVPLHDHMTTTTMAAPITGADWYDGLSLVDQDRYDKIEEMCPEFSNLDAAKCQEFLDILDDYGIEDADKFESAYCTQIDYAHNEQHYGEFVEYLVTEFDDKELPEYLVIDWQQSWYSNYRHDFIDIEFDGEVYFFFANF